MTQIFGYLPYIYQCHIKSPVIEYYIDPGSGLPYVTAVNIDPQDPVFNISYPRDYSHGIVGKVGLFSTLGMPHDTWAEHL